MPLFDRFCTSTGQPQSHQKSLDLGLGFKSRLSDIHETFGKMWAKFRARLGRILLSCGTCVKLSGFGYLSPWVSHSNKPKFQSKIKRQKKTKKPNRTGKKWLAQEWNGLCHIPNTFQPLDSATELLLLLLSRFSRVRLCGTS